MEKDLFEEFYLEENFENQESEKEPIEDEENNKPVIEKEGEEALADMFEETEKESKTKGKNKKGSTTTSAAAKQKEEHKSMKGYKIIVYGDELFTVDNDKTTTEDIRKSLEETYQYIEFSKKHTVIFVDDDKKVITPHVKFQPKG